MPRSVPCRPFHVAVFIVIAVLSGCGGGGLSSAPPVPPAPSGEAAPAPVEQGVPSNRQGLTVFYQYMPVSDGREDYASAGSPNSYAVSESFSARSGIYQIGFSGAFQLGIAQGTSSMAFPASQSYAELTFLTPDEQVPAGAVFGPALVQDPGTAQGMSWEQFANTTTIAWLTSSPDSRLQQVVDMPAAPSGPLALTWQTIFAGGLRAHPGYTSGEPRHFRVVLRTPAGDPVSTLFEERDGVVSGTDGYAAIDLPAYAGQTLVLSFEARTSNRAPRDEFGAGIDNISLKDGATELLANGNFESGGAGWTTTAPATSQNVLSGTRTVAGLEVQRAAYVPATEKWGRWTDTVSNRGSTTITATVTYETELGWRQQAIIQAPVGAPAQALTLWDALGYWRDTGLVFGNASQVTYSAPGAPVHLGSVRWGFPVTIPPGRSVSIVQFLIQTANATWQTAPDANARAVEAEAIATDIATNFRTDPKYRKGMTQRQLDTILNF